MNCIWIYVGALAPKQAPAVGFLILGLRVARQTENT